jgi:hypothetical protein
MNQFNIGMLLGSGKLLGIGKDTHPDNDIASAIIIIITAIITPVMGLFFNFEHSA